MTTSKHPVTETIISTLAFFALFSRPLTRTEIIEFAFAEGQTLSTEALEAELTARSPYWYHSNGYYYLRAAKYTRPVKEMKAVSDAYMKKSKRYLSLLRHIPYIRFVGVVNTVAFGAARTDSDIDVFIITKENRIWITRFLVTCLLHLLGVRRYGTKTAGRFCLSFFIDESALDFSKIALEKEDIYLSFWIKTLIPIWSNDMYRRFIDANTVLLSPFPHIMQRKALLVPSTSKVRQWLEAVGDSSLGLWLQKLLVNIQKKKMQHFPVPQNIFSSVVVSDHMLKFHNNDRRERYRDTWRVLRHKAYKES